MTTDSTVNDTKMISSGMRLASLGLIAAVLVSACTNRPHRAPVEERVATPRSAVGRAPSPPASSPVALDDTGSALAAEVPVSPGYYAVRPGDTLIRIALENGQNWKDLVKWNEL